MIKRTLLTIFLLCSVCFSESTNLVGVSKGWFLLTDEQTIGRYTNEVNYLEASRPSKGKLVMSTSGKVISGSYFLNLLDISPRIYLFSQQKNTNRTLVVVAMPPFPKLERANFTSLDSYIFELKNTVEFKARPIEKEIFDKLVNNLFIWKNNNTPLQKPRSIHNEKTIQPTNGLIDYFILEDLYSFTTLHPEKRRRDWLFPFRYYEQKISLKEKEKTQPSSQIEKKP